MNRYRERLRWLYENGMAHIFGSSFLNKVFHFAGNACIARILTKTEYGTFGFADSIMAFVLTVSGLGMTSGLLQFCSERRGREEKKAYARFGFIVGALSNLVLIAGCLLYAAFGYFKNDAARPILAIYSLYPMTYFFFDYYTVMLRTKKKNKDFALVTNLNAGLYALSGIIASFLIKEAGIVAGLYIATVTSALVGRRKFRKDDKTEGIYRLSGGEKKGLIRFSVYSSTGRVMTNLLIFVDVFLIGIILPDPADLASYRIATTIPLALMFVPDSIIMFVYPYIAENRTDYGWLKDKMKTLFGASAGVNAFITAGLVIFAPLIVHTIWGQKYDSAVYIFRILSINYFVTATIRYNLINVLTALGRVKTILMVNLIAGSVNIALDIIMIKWLGAEGAAWATLAVVMFTSAILIPVFIRVMLRIRAESANTVKETA